MAVNGTGSLVVLVAVLLTALPFLAQVEGKRRNNFQRDMADNVSRIIDHSDKIKMKPKEAKPGQFPWMVYVRTETMGVSWCGGSIIDRQWIMSAAHCITAPVYDKTLKSVGYKIKAKRIDLIAGIIDRVDLGKHQLTSINEEEIKAVGEKKQVFIPKDYNKGAHFHNDIVLFKLVDPLKLNEFVQPILLTAVEDIFGHPLTVSGWGGMNYKGTHTAGCEFPFYYEKTSNSKCVTTEDITQPWCAVAIDENNLPTETKYCDGDDTAECIFPFKYSAISTSECVKGDEDPYYWCGTKTGFKWCDDITGCKFPFTYRNKEYTECTTIKRNRPWCSTKTNKKYGHKKKHWKYCDDYIDSPNNLRYVNGLKSKSNVECKSILPGLSDSKFCHINKDKGIYFGDSGGPVIFQLRKSNPPIYVQVGIVSGVPRDANLPYVSLFTNVARLRPWIYTTMGYSPQVSSNNECPDGFLQSSGRWYRLFKNTKKDWEGAKLECQSVNMKIAEPIGDAVAVALRKDLLDKYGNYPAWLGAKGTTDGKKFLFISGAAVKSTLLTKEVDVTTGRCLMLNAMQSDWEDLPDRPYHSDSCTELFYALCEDSPDKPKLPDGFVYSSGIWYRMLEGKKVNWEKAKKMCHGQGMRLAEPTADKVVQLRRDALNKLGEFSGWIGARFNADDHKFVFEEDKHVVHENSLLMEFPPPDNELEPFPNCLELHMDTESWEYRQDAVYVYSTCSRENSYPLCENIPYREDPFPPPLFCPSCSRTFLTRSGLEKCVTETCPDDGDFFTPTGSKQCFKVLDTSATWEQAYKDCKSSGLELAEPIDSDQLRKSLVERLKTDDPGFYVWLGACQFEPNKMTWKNSKTEITADDSLWYPGQPDHSEGCLLLLSSKEYLEEEPDKPFWNVLPTYEFQPLCELILE